MCPRGFFQPKIGGHLFDPEAHAAAPPSQRLVKMYHERTKHRLQRYAEGPETLDWESQPNPFRKFEGTINSRLPLSALDFSSSITALFGEPQEPVPLSLESLGAFLELSLALNAWKSLGPDRWALRCAPSSGNLHPIEAYLITSGIAGLVDALYHYEPQDHALERRAHLKDGQRTLCSGFFVGLSSIYWREAWKYGERAFRYTHLDLGHVIGSLSAAASSLGWQISAISQLDTETLATLLGTNRSEDFRGAEPECPEILLNVAPRPVHESQNQHGYEALCSLGDWQGQANCLDPRPMYRWPVIDQVQQATVGVGNLPTESFSQEPVRVEKRLLTNLTAGQLIQHRRSAQAFDPDSYLPYEQFLHLLTLLETTGNSSDFDLIMTGEIHFILWIHRVQEMTPGLYLIGHEKNIDSALQSSLNPEFEWAPIYDAKLTVPLWRLGSLDNPQLAKKIHCHQSIASDAMLLIGCISDFSSAIDRSSWNYRGLHWKCGMLGHRIYLSAEALGYRATGIGCFFDDDYHSLLGLSDARYQALYHLAVGKPLLDHRIEDFPPYPHRISKN